jgi:anti-sigma B factor antagonist
MLGELRVDPSATVVTLHGELDMMTVESLRGLLREACATEPRRVVVDLSNVPFVDVLSLSTILAAADGQRDRGATLLVTGASSPVRRICALLNAEDVLEPVLPMPRVAVL